MEITVSKEVIEELCPEAFDKLPEGPYRVYFAEKIEGVSGEDFAEQLLSGTLPERKEPSPEERFEKQVMGVQLRSGRKTYNAKNLKEVFQHVIINEFHRLEEELREEEERFLSLSEEEQVKEINDNLNELRKMGGFLELMI